METLITVIEKILWYGSILLLIIACLGAGCENPNSKTAEAVFFFALLRTLYFCLVSLRFSKAHGNRHNVSKRK